MCGSPPDQRGFRLGGMDTVGPTLPSDESLLEVCRVAFVSCLYLQTSIDQPQVISCYATSLLLGCFSFFYDNPFFLPCLPPSSFLTPLALHLAVIRGYLPLPVHSTRSSPLLLGRLGRPQWTPASSLCLHLPTLPHWTETHFAEGLRGVCEVLGIR